MKNSLLGTLQKGLMDTVQTKLAETKTLLQNPDMSGLIKDKIGKDKTIIITGASSGIGAGMARIFGKLGYNLAICARRTERLETLKAEILAENPEIRVELKALDVSDYDAVFETFKEFQQLFNSIDRVIVNAGVGEGRRVGTGRFHINRRTAEINFISALAQCEAAMEIFRAQNFGHLVAISSIVIAP